MKTIWKYPMDVQDTVTLQLPKGAELLTLQTQHRVPTLWFLVDPEQPLEAREFSTYGTGWKLPNDPGKRVGTYLSQDEAFVWHVFEKTKC